MKSWIRSHQLVSFFVLAYLIMYGVIFGYILLCPGQPLMPWSIIWFLGIFSPTISAALVSWIIGGAAEVKAWLAGFTRWKVGLGWYFAAAFLLLGPLVIALGYDLLANPATGGPKPGLAVSAVLGITLFQFFSGPLSEEAGWRGFALPRLEARHNALVSSLILGVLWTCWHLPFFFLTGATQMSIPFPIYLLLVVTLTLYLTWLYNNAHGSLIITTLAHFCYNLSSTIIVALYLLMPAMLFYLTAGPLLFLVVIGLVIYYGPRNLSRKPVTELPFRRDAPLQHTATGLPDTQGS